MRVDDIGAIQSAHLTPTPRIGGVAIICAIALSIAFSPATVQADYFLLCLTVLPVFVVGLAEDLGFPVSPRRRLYAAAVSSLLAIYLLNTWITRLDFPALDILLSWAPAGIAFTVLATVGVSNAFNLIDGLNGLSSGTAIITALGLAAISSLGDDPALVQLCLMFVAAMFGFLMFNYPWGRLFLGDAGAYSVGYILSWLAIFVHLRNPDISAWAILLLFFWPVADTMLAIYRRRAAGMRSDKPDRLHFHQLVMRAIEILWLGRNKRSLANPLATLTMLPMIMAPVATGVLLWNEPTWSFIAVVGFSVLFVGCYLVGMQIAASRTRSR